ncbi:hypothetical protein [Streptomyces sp. NPDC004250]|uniref:hypothetical protein n=1 Tax=Streptomyces sp. NPDC004250 TaxID=3364692 RepID=UPI003697F5A0
MFFTALYSPASLLFAGVFFFALPALSWWRGKARAGSERVRAYLRARAARLQRRVRVWLLGGHPAASGEDVRAGYDEG